LKPGAARPATTRSPTRPTSWPASAYASAASSSGCRRRRWKAVGVTFPQIQKYESGKNRISTSRLQQFADLLSVAPAHFFTASGVVLDPATDRETLEVMRLYQRAPRSVSGELERHCGADHFGTRMAFAAVNDADWRQLADNNIRMVDAVERTIAQRQSFADRVANGRGDARGRA
jgi:transcriptional regulator with XRE-family HTH domain